jgi:hypothetical protein
MRWLSLVLVAAAVGCSDSSGPGAVQIEGTWAGDYTNTETPGVIYEAVLQLNQDGTEITGSLTTNAGRSATIVNGQVDETRFSATFEYTDECAGTAEMTADVVEGTTSLVGNYTSTDCVGPTAGGFNLAKQ